jgi:dephospho-CoA kinase
VKAWKRKMLRRRPHVGLGVVEAALLHEGGWTSLFDGILCVSAPERVRRARLKKRGWDLGGIRHRERLQWTDRRKVRHSDWILTNSGTKRELRSRVEKWRNHRGFGGTD